TKPQLVKSETLPDTFYEHHPTMDGTSHYSLERAHVLPDVDLNRVKPEFIGNERLESLLNAHRVNSVIDLSDNVNKKMSLPDIDLESSNPVLVKSDRSPLNAQESTSAVSHRSISHYS
ncbi:hypothetical protein, partial [Salmonella enterica]|uniref:hypothetical protein n=1 Tax=Salmonella enterica TaxID=28901 RepID=UPI00352357AC